MRLFSIIVLVVPANAACTVALEDAVEENSAEFRHLHPRHFDLPTCHEGQSLYASLSAFASGNVIESMLAEDEKIVVRLDAAASETTMTVPVGEDRTFSLEFDASTIAAASSEEPPRLEVQAANNVQVRLLRVLCQDLQNELPAQAELGDPEQRVTLDAACHADQVHIADLTVYFRTDIKDADLCAASTIEVKGMVKDSMTPIRYQPDPLEARCSQDTPLDWADHSARLVTPHTTALSGVNWTEFSCPNGSCSNLIVKRSYCCPTSVLDKDPELCSHYTLTF